MHKNRGAQCFCTKSYLQLQRHRGGAEAERRSLSFLGSSIKETVDERRLHKALIINPEDTIGFLDEIKVSAWFVIHHISFKKLCRFLAIFPSIYIRRRS